MTTANRIDPQPENRLLVLSGEPSGLSVLAAEGESKLTRFRVVAYTGRAVNLSGWPHPVIVDLDGMKFASQSIPLRSQHVATAGGIGHTERIAIESSKVIAEGVVSRETETASEFIASAKKGFPWQASIGASADEYEFVQEKQSAEANGKTWKGPCYIVRKSTLTEISIVDLGADLSTAVRVAAQSQVKGEHTMPEETKDVKAGAETQAPVEDKKVEAAPTLVDPAEAVRTNIAAEYARIAEVSAAAEGHPDIAAKAVKEKWTKEKTELEVLKAERPKAPAVQVQDKSVSFKTLEAAAMQSARVPEKDRIARYGAETVEAADKEFKGRMGLQRMLLEAAWLNGCRVRFVDSDSARREVLQAAFSTKDVDGILGNTANKSLLSGFQSVENVWSEISSPKTVSDLKSVTSYRMLDNLQFEAVGPTGELHHGMASEETFTNQARTYGITFAISREAQINDDLGAITDVPMRMGRGAGEKVNDVFWTAFFALSFTGQNASTGVFGLAGLTAAELKFLDKTYSVTVQGKTVTKPLNLDPRILLVPNALKTSAENLMGSANLLATGSTDATMAQTNPHAGKWVVKATRYFGNASYGNSSVKYCLLADPAQLPVLRVAWLNGVQQPTIESADADFNTLGIQMRGYFDFGVGDAEVRAGVMSSGS